MAKIMGLFICPDIHELALLSFIEKLKFPRIAVLSSTSVKMRIQGFLLQFKEKYPECSSEDTVNRVTTMMEDLDFLIPLSQSESDDHHVLNGILIPSLHPFGKFWWNFKENSNQILTIGRTVTTMNGMILGHLFCNFQVQFIICCFEPRMVLTWDRFTY